MGSNVTVSHITSFNPLTPNLGQVFIVANHTAISPCYEHIYISILTPHNDLMEWLERKTGRSIRRGVTGGSSWAGKAEQRNIDREYSFSQCEGRLMSGKLTIFYKKDLRELNLKKIKHRNLVYICIIIIMYILINLYTKTYKYI